MSRGINIRYRRTGHKLHKPFSKLHLHIAWPEPNCGGLFPGMRVHTHSNLTVELIRAHHSGIACAADTHRLAAEEASLNQVSGCDVSLRRTDRVQLSQQALGNDAKANECLPIATALPVDETEIDAEPRVISPVVGSPHLAGLGISWVVPGTLLDVVA